MLDNGPVDSEQGSKVLKVNRHRLGREHRRFLSREPLQLARREIRHVISNHGQVAPPTSCEREPRASGAVRCALVRHPAALVEGEGRLPVEFKDFQLARGRCHSDDSVPDRRLGQARDAKPARSRVGLRGR